jgi:XTP/dITP diphosphohydrolase
LKPVLVATRSRGKLREVQAIFASAGVASIGLDQVGLQFSEAEEQLEAHATFEENALAKARYFHAATLMPVVADDSGLEVAALGGAPGVLSKRWSGDPGGMSDRELDERNNHRLMSELAGVRDRRARYVCAAAYREAGTELVARGETWGLITEEARGSNGFGYDPYFLSDELGITFGESVAAEKEAVSHRGRAFRALLSQMMDRR